MDYAESWFRIQLLFLLSYKLLVYQLATYFIKMTTPYCELGELICKETMNCFFHPVR